MRKLCWIRRPPDPRPPFVPAVAEFTKLDPAEKARGSFRENDFTPKNTWPRGTSVPKLGPIPCPSFASPRCRCSFVFLPRPCPREVHWKTFYTYTGLCPLWHPPGNCELSAPLRSCFFVRCRFGPGTVYSNEFRREHQHSSSYLARSTAPTALSQRGDVYKEWKRSGMVNRINETHRSSRIFYTPEPKTATRICFYMLRINNSVYMYLHW